MPRTAMKPPHGYDENKKPIFAFNDKGVPVCGAKLGKSRAGQICMSQFRLQNGRCKMHGGAVPVGPANGNFKHGKFSTLLPDNMKDNFKNFLENPDILNMRADLALQDLRIAELLSAFNENDTNEANWKRLNELCDEVIPIIHALDGNSDTMDPFAASFELVNVVKQFIKHIKAGTDNKKLFKEISDASLVRAKLTEVEARRLEKEKDYMPYDQVMVLFTQIMLSVKKHVTDKRIRNAIAADCDMLSALPRNQVALAGRQGAGGILLPESEMARILDHDIDGLVTLHQNGESYPMEEYEEEGDENGSEG